MLLNMQLLSLLLYSFFLYQTFTYTFILKLSVFLSYVRSLYEKLKADKEETVKAKIIVACLIMLFTRRGLNVDLIQ